MNNWHRKLTAIFSIYGICGNVGYLGIILWDICGIFGYYILNGRSLSILKGDLSESWIEIWRAQNF